MKLIKVLAIMTFLFSNSLIAGKWTPKNTYINDGGVEIVEGRYYISKSLGKRVRVQEYLSKNRPKNPDYIVVVPDGGKTFTHVPPNDLQGTFQP